MLDLDELDRRAVRDEYERALQTYLRTLVRQAFGKTTEARVHDAFAGHMDREARGFRHDEEGRLQWRAAVEQQSKSLPVTTPALT